MKPAQVPAAREVVMRRTDDVQVVIEPRAIGLEVAAQVYGQVCAETIRRLQDEEGFPCVRYGTRRLVPVAAADAWLAARAERDTTGGRSMSGRPEPSWAWLDADTAIRCAEESLTERAAGLGGQSADWWVGHHEATIRSLCAVLRREAAAARSQAPSSKAGPVPSAGPADEDDDSLFAQAFRAEMARSS